MKPGVYKIRPIPELKDKSLDELWRHLNQNEKEYLLIFPAFDSKIDSVKWLRREGLIPDASKKASIMQWVYHRRIDSKWFRQFEHLRPSLNHDDVIALYKKDKELLMWTKLGADVKNGKVAKKDDMSVLRKLGGKIAGTEIPVESEAPDWEKMMGIESSA